MTELEAAYNQGVSDATRIIRFSASQIPPAHCLGPLALVTLADSLDELKVSDPIPDAAGWFPNDVCGGSA